MELGGLGISPKFHAALCRTCVFSPVNLSAKWPIKLASVDLVVLIAYEWLIWERKFPPYLLSYVTRSAHYVTHVCCLLNYQPILVLPKSAHYVTHVNYITNYHPLCNLGLLRGMRFMAILLCPVLFLYLAQSCRERGQAASVRLAPCWALFRGSWAARAWRDGLRVLDVHTRCTCVLRVCKCLHVCACVCVGVCGFVWVNVCSCVCWCLSGVPG